MDENKIDLCGGYISSRDQRCAREKGHKYPCMTRSEMNDESRNSSSPSIDRVMDEVGDHLWAKSLKNLLGERAGEAFFKHAKQVEGALDRAKQDRDELAAKIVQVQEDLLHQSYSLQPVQQRLGLEALKENADLKQQVRELEEVAMRPCPAGSKCEACGNSVGYSFGRRKNLCHACLKASLKAISWPINLAKVVGLLAALAALVYALATRGL